MLFFHYFNPGIAIGGIYVFFTRYGIHEGNYLVQVDGGPEHYARYR